MKIADVAIRRPVTTLTLMGALVIFGWMAFTRMGLDLFPEVELPYVTVTTILPGASPEVMDQDVTDVLEEQIAAISGVKSLFSFSGEGYSTVAVEFELEKDVDVAAEEVRAKVNLAERNLPRDVERPVVEKIDLAAQQSMWVAVSSRGDYRELAHFADKVVKERLQSVTGVGNITLGGLREREIRVWLDPERLQAYGLTAQEVVGMIRARHLELPGGRVETGELEYSVIVEGEYRSAAELAELAVARRGGALVRLKDLGRIDDGLEDLRTIARFNGIPTIGLGIRKQSGANTVAVAEAVTARLDEIRTGAPDHITIEIASDNSQFIKASMRGVQMDLILGVLLTAAIMYIFLRNVRVTAISVVSIPISLVGGFVLMNTLGFSVNNMTMLAMSLAVGMVIDDTVVVLENIFRHVENGEPPMQAASTGTREVGTAVIASTSSIAAVFIPVAFMRGIIGRFFFQFGLTLALTIAISTFVALTLTPMLGSRALRHRPAEHWLYRTLERTFTALERRYRTTLGWAVRHRLAVLGVAFLSLVAGLALIPAIGTEFFTPADESRYLVRFELPTGTGIDRADARLRELEELLIAQDEVAGLFGAVGIGRGQNVNIGNLFVTLVPREQRAVTQEQMIRRTRELLAPFDDMVSSVGPLEIVAGGGRAADVEMVIQGPSVEELAAVADAIVAEMQAEGVFVDVDTNLRLTKPEVRVRINRDLANDLNVDAMAISNEIYTLFGGIEAAYFKDQGYRYAIRVRALPDARQDPEQLLSLTVRNRQGDLIKAPNLLLTEVGVGPNTINRYNRQRSVTLYANADGISPGEALRRAETIVESRLPGNGLWSADLVGQAQVFRESFGALLSALLIAILVIYMVLAIQFESFIHPFTIMASLPLGLFGVFAALLITGMTLNIFSFIGIIMLVGIVAKNSILLVDFANQQRAAGLDKVAAILAAGPLRLRPILMTAASTVIAVLPVALAISEGGETRAPLAVAVMGGMFSSTLLTLLVVPVVYLLMDDARDLVTGLFRRSPAPATAPQGPGDTP